MKPNLHKAEKTTAKTQRRKEMKTQEELNRISKIILDF